MAQILLIEPDSVLADIHATALKSAGHEVVKCAGAQAAIMAADRARPDLVLLELQLVEHSGVEFLYEFRSYLDWQFIPVVLLTGVPAAEFAGSRELMSRELGVRDYLYKPQTSLSELLKRVEKYKA